MSYVHELNMNDLSIAFNKILELSNSLFQEKEIIYEELDKLKQTYHKLMKNNNKKIYIFCLDSFYFQYSILHKEMDNLTCFISLLHNRMYGEYYKLYNIIFLQLNEQNIQLKSISENKKHPIYKDLEQLKEYSREDIADIHNSVVTIINELYIYYSNQQNIIKDYETTNNINATISNFIQTLKYENALLREQLYLYVSYVVFFHSTHLRYLEKIYTRIKTFKNDVAENIVNHNKNTLFIDNVTNIKDVILTTPPNSPSVSIHSELTFDISDTATIPESEIPENNIGIVGISYIMENYGLDGIITTGDIYSEMDK